jgi:hypothetical protein
VQLHLAILQREPEEVRHLYEDVLIHVTSFFRDPDGPSVGGSKRSATSR